MNVQPIKTWGFALVRCTYQDEERWKAFLSEIERQALEYLKEEHATPQEIEYLKERLQMTVIEEKSTLDGATMQQANAIFRDWVKSEAAAVQEKRRIMTPRWRYYVYVNEESIESLLNPIRAQEVTGYFVILVNAIFSNNSEDDDQGEEDEDMPEEVADESFKLVAADALVYHYEMYALNPNGWYSPGDWRGPPFVYSRGSWTKLNWWIQLLEEDEKGMIGMDVYDMLKQIYGEGHWRSKAFMGVEKSKGQMLRGYHGGFNFPLTNKEKG